MATRQLLAEMTHDFTSAGGTPLALESVGGVDAARRVREGEAFDLVFLASDAIAKLAASGHVLPATQVNLVRSQVAVAVKSGATPADIATAAGVRQAVLQAPTIGYSTGPSGNALLALFERWEIGGAYNFTEGTNQNDYLVHTKLRFAPWSGRGNSALAIGGSYQSLNSSPSTTVGQIYFAATYEAQFFGMEADTSIVVGKTFGTGVRDGDVDFSMGFDLNLFPSVFNGYVRWLNELSNYDFLYLNAPTAAIARGAFNTGLRIPVLKNMTNLRFDITLKMTDALDNERGFGAGAVFGARF